MTNPHPQYPPEHRVWSAAQLDRSLSDTEVLESAGYVPHDGTLLRDELLAQYRRDCGYHDRVQRKPMDRSAAFTALLDLSPEFREADTEVGSQMISRMPGDFYESGQTNIYAYARGWLTASEAERELEAG